MRRYIPTLNCRGGTLRPYRIGKVSRDILLFLSERFFFFFFLSVHACTYTQSYRQSVGCHPGGTRDFLLFGIVLKRMRIIPYIYVYGGVCTHCSSVLLRVKTTRFFVFLCSRDVPVAQRFSENEFARAPCDVSDTRESVEKRRQTKKTDALYNNIILSNVTYTARIFRCFFTLLSRVNRIAALCASVSSVILSTSALFPHETLRDFER